DRPMIVCRARLPRAGLGNRLFPWARCRVFSLATGVSVLGPPPHPPTLPPPRRADAGHILDPADPRPAAAEAAGPAPVPRPVPAHRGRGRGLAALVAPLGRERD